MTLEEGFGGLEFERPLWLTYAPGDEETYVVMAQRGVAWWVHRAEGEWTRTKMLDMQDRVRREHNEEGMLGLTFHPAYAEGKRRVYVYYSASDPRRTVLSWMKGPSDAHGRVDAGSEEVLLEMEQPWGNHNGGTVLFGPDGYLYLGYGDGGAAGDPNNNAQDLGTLLGSIIRIDVDASSGDEPYGIPEDNPFVDQKGARPEIWAYGLRNPWRMSFDRKTNALWVGDVGQNAWEEIDVVEAGGNYGWDIREGTHPYEPRKTDAKLIDPVAEYSHERGQSVTGGYVYRGERYDALKGVYLYADFVSGRIWGLRYEDGEATTKAELAHPEIPISSFGEGPEGELFVTAFDGKVYRVAVE